jgi:hypothetical protein
MLLIHKNKFRVYPLLTQVMRIKGIEYGIPTIRIAPKAEVFCKFTLLLLDKLMYGFISQGMSGSVLPKSCSIEFLACLYIQMNRHGNCG